MQKGRIMGSVTTLFRNAVQRFSARSALIEPTGGDQISTLTYRALQERVHMFAGYLQQQQIAKGERLMIWSASRADWLIAYFGALLVGMVVVPLDVNTKEDFLVRIAKTTEVKFLVTTQKQYNGLQHPPAPLIDIDALPQSPLDMTQLPPIDENDLAELVFTSGTTGQPKGVMLSHHNIASNAIAAAQAVDIRSSDRALSILPLSHMFEMTIEIAIIHVGASVVYARTLVPDTLLKLFSSQQVTCMVLVPQALQLFLNSIEREVRRLHKEKQWELLHRIAAQLPFSIRRYVFGTVHKRFGGHFRFFVSGGAYLPPKIAQSWEEMGFRVLHGYGVTECAPVVSVNPSHDHHFESVGKPLPQVEIRIAADQEILVHGPNVALGYWKNPDATAASFKDGWYYTGDLGYLDARMNLHLKGRKKNLIVLANGLNVYPEDVENVLQSDEAIREAIVFGLTQQEQGPEVHAILLMDDPSKAKAAVQHANKQLASHQHVRGFTIWPEQDFPRTHTLKVKRQDVLDKLQALQNANQP
jgi:long-chain acyl-CoA synthetase